MEDFTINKFEDLTQQECDLKLNQTFVCLIGSIFFDVFVWLYDFALQEIQLTSVLRMYICGETNEVWLDIPLWDSSLATFHVDLHFQF